MPTVVIIHAADDALPARALAEKLRHAAKLTVVLEQPPGEELRNAVKGAAVTVALWSPRSVTQSDLAEEVAFAKTKSKLVHALMQRAQPPEQFRNDKPVDLTGWRGEEDFPTWRELAKLVADKAGVALAPPPPPRPPSGFFQPGRPAEAVAAGQAQQRASVGRQQTTPRAAPQPRGAAEPRPAAHYNPPRSEPRASTSAPAERGGGGGRALVIGAIAFVVIALAGGGGYWFWSQSQNSQAASTAWENVDRNDAEALRAFMAGSPGQFRDDAQAALTQLEERSYEAASDADTIEALEAFVRDFPDSEHALVARGRIAELRSLPQEPTEEELETLAPDAPTDPDLVPPGTTPEASGGPAPLTPPAEDPPEPSQPDPDEPVN
jgi:hypothetical protein